MTAQYPNRTWTYCLCGSQTGTWSSPLKCQVTGYRKPINAAYSLHSVSLEIVTCARYLGVDISTH